MLTHADVGSSNKVELGSVVIHTKKKVVYYPREGWQVPDRSSRASSIPVIWSSRTSSNPVICLQSHESPHASGVNVQGLAFFF
jgi:hypothetical protein